MLGLESLKCFSIAAENVFFYVSFLKACASFFILEFYFLYHSSTVQTVRLIIFVLFSITVTSTTVRRDCLSLLFFTANDFFREFHANRKRNNYNPPPHIIVVVVVDDDAWRFCPRVVHTGTVVVEVGIK